MIRKLLNWAMNIERNDLCFFCTSVLRPYFSILDWISSGFSPLPVSVPNAEAMSSIGLL